MRGFFARESDEVFEILRRLDLGIRRGRSFTS